MKVKKFNLFSVLSNLLSSVALIGVKPACGGWIYQPKAPKHLSEK